MFGKVGGRIATSVVVLLFGGPLLLACSPKTGATDPSPSLILNSDISWATYRGFDGGSDTAKLTGVLAEELGCLVVVDTSSGVKTLPVFPTPEVSFNGKSLVFTAPEGEHQLGSEVSFGGGGHTFGEDPPPGVDFGGCEGRMDSFFIVGIW